MENTIYYTAIGLVLSIITDEVTGGFTTENITNGMIIDFCHNHKSVELYVYSDGHISIAKNKYPFSEIETGLKSFFSC